VLVSSSREKHPAAGLEVLKGRQKIVSREAKKFHVSLPPLQGGLL
jgi:hypothetical protein